MRGSELNFHTRPFFLIRTHSLVISGVLVLSAMVVGASAQRLPVRIYKSSDGLGSSAVNEVMRDSRGFLWFSTRDGLSRFDGLRFKTYQFESPASPYITHLVELRNGDYLATAQRGGVYRFNADTFVEETGPSGQFSSLLIKAERVLPESVGQIVEDADEKLWAAGFGSGLLRLNDNGENGGFSIERVPLFIPGTRDQPGRIESLMLARDGSLWMITERGLFRLLRDGKTVFYASESKTPLKSFLTSVFEDSDNLIWVGTLRGVVVLKPAPPSESTSENFRKLKPLRNPGNALPVGEDEAVEFTAEDNLYGKPVTAFYQTSDRRVWIAGTGGLAAYAGGKISRFDAPGEIGTYLNDIVEDDRRNLWIAAGSGVYKINGEGFAKFDRTQGLKDVMIHSVYQSAGGQIYVVNGDWFVSRLREKDDKEYFETVRPPPLAESVGETGWTSSVAFLDRQNSWWFLTSDKLYRFDGTSESQDLARALPSVVYDNRNFGGGSFYRMWEDSEGDIWLSNNSADSRQNSLARLRITGRDGQFKTFGEAEDFPKGLAASAFAEDSRGNRWFGFSGGGLARYRDGRFQLFTVQDGLPKGSVTGILVDRRGRLWIATVEGGLGVLADTGAENPEFSRYTTSEGLASNNVRAVTEDDFGRIYAGTVRGIDRLSPDDGGRIRHYSTESGLPDDFITFAMREKNGNLWFGTRNGLARLEPKADRQTTEPPILIGGLRIAGNKQVVSELGQTEIVLPEFDHQQNNLQIDFFSISFSDADQIRYQYRLDSSSASDWSQPVAERSVTIANLAPGDYTFAVRAVNTDGMTSRRPATVRLSIAPPLWQKSWFVALSLLAGGAFFFAFERYRAGKVQALRSAFGEIKLSETRFRRLLEQSPLGTVIFAPDGRIRSVNQAYEQFWGVRFDQVKDRHFLSDTQLAGAGVAEKLRDAFKGEFVAFEAAVCDLRKNGAGIEGFADEHTKWLLAFAYPVKNDAGDLLEVVLVIEDITEKKLAEKNLQEIRTEKARELEHVRKRIAADLHDDIGSSLTQISILSEVLQQNGKTETGKIKDALKSIASSSRELVDAMSDIVWAINPQKDHLSDLTGKMRRFAADSFSPRGIKFTFDAPDLEDDLSLGANLRREVFLIFKEAINNVVKHAGARCVEISLNVKASEIRLRLRDDGRGMDTEKGGDGHGLSSMAERANSLSGSFKIKSNCDGAAGTVIELCVPLGINPPNRTT